MWLMFVRVFDRIYRGNLYLTLIIKLSLSRCSIEFDDSLFRFLELVPESGELSEVGVRTPDFGRVSVEDASGHCCSAAMSPLDIDIWHEGFL